MIVDKIVGEAERIRKKLLESVDKGKYVDRSRMAIPRPKCGSGRIELIIIGQDPTVRNVKSRDKIETVLNLDKKNSLFHYVSEIAEGIGCNSLNENVYATNLLKCFYSEPPAGISGLVQEQTAHWIHLLCQEISQYPKAKIVTLGEPVLKALVKNGSNKVRSYWGYKGKNEANVDAFNACSARDNLLERTIFPFPHQPSRRKVFYSNYLKQYMNYVANSKK